MSEYECMMHISGNEYVVFADANRYCSNTGGFLYRFGKAVGNEEMVRMGFAHMDLMEVKDYCDSHLGTGHKMVLDLLTRREILEGRDAEVRQTDSPLTRAFERLQVMSCRENHDRGGVFLCCKGGHNNDSRNHNDIGSFVLYLDSR